MLKVEQCTFWLKKYVSTLERMHETILYMKSEHEIVHEQLHSIPQDKLTAQRLKETRSSGYSKLPEKKIKNWRGK
jgi:hypothetical protein